MGAGAGTRESDESGTGGAPPTGFIPFMFMPLPILLPIVGMPPMPILFMAPGIGGGEPIPFIVGPPIP